jgi:hypothetical protein
MSSIGKEKPMESKVVNRDYTIRRKKNLRSEFSNWRNNSRLSSWLVKGLRNTYKSKLITSTLRLKIKKSSKRKNSSV